MSTASERLVDDSRRSGTTEDDAEETRPPWISRNPLKAAFLLILALSMGFRFAILKDGYFITDDFMLTTRALENDLGWDYLTRVHTGHFEPVGFGTMWLFAHFAPLNWPVTVAVMVAAQVLLAVMVWRLLTTLFGMRPLALIPFAVYCLTPLTVPAFTWLSAAIIWMPLTAAIAGALRQHVLYVRSGRPLHALGAGLWFAFGAASFEKVLVFLPFVVVFTLVLVPKMPLRPGPLLRLLRRTWLVWLSYAVVTIAYLAVYLPSAARADGASGIRAPSPGAFWDFAYLTILQTFIPVSLGGPWQWTPVSYATGIVASPRAFDWALWVLAALIVLVTLTVRRGMGRAWLALATYLFVSLLTLAISRVPIIGSVAGLETRYVADAAVPLVVVVGLCIMPMKDEERAWLPTHLPGLSDIMTRRAQSVAATVLAAVLFTLSLHALNGYAKIQAGNPFEDFTEAARVSAKDLPAEAQVFDTGMPVDVIGPLFLEYNLTTRFLSPFVSEARRKQMYALDTFTNPYLLTRDGDLVPMKVEGAKSPAPAPGSCGWLPRGDEIRVPLDSTPFPWTWTVRMGYLTDRDTTATVTLGRGAREVQLRQGLGEVTFTVEGGDDTVVISGLDPQANICVGDVQVGQAVPR